MNYPDPNQSPQSSNSRPESNEYDPTQQSSLPEEQPQSNPYGQYGPPPNRDRQPQGGDTPGGPYGPLPRTSEQPQHPHPPYGQYGPQANRGDQPQGGNYDQYGQTQNPPPQPTYGQPAHEQPPSYNQQQQYNYQQPNYAQGYAATGKVAAGLAYLFGWIGGLIVLLITDKQNRFVRFHAIQSILFSVAWTIIGFILGILSNSLPDGAGSVINFLSSIVEIVFLVTWIVLMVNAFRGRYFKLPIIGDYAERYANQATIAV